MKKIIFRSAVCVMLALSTVLCLASCGTKMDRYEDKLEELEDDGEIYGYSECTISQKNNFEDNIEDESDIEVEIEEMYTVSDGGAFIFGGYAYVIEFKTTSQAKKFVKVYEEDAGIGFDAKMERVIDLIEGDFDGDVDELFEFDYACERDGKVVVCGYSDIVEAIVK